MMDEIHENRKSQRNVDEFLDEFSTKIEFAELKRCKGKDACRFDRSRKMLKHEPSLAIWGVDTAEYGPKKQMYNLTPLHLHPI